MRNRQCLCGFAPGVSATLAKARTRLEQAFVQKYPNSF